MVGLRTIDRTAVFAWSPGASAPLLVTGTRTGAVSDDFSDETKLELWDLALDQIEPLGELSPKGSVSTDAGFNDIAWSEPDDKYPLGVIAGALENGSVDLWDAAKLRQGASDAHISRTTKHSGAVKALQWNPYRQNLLASAGAKGEIYLYDLNNMSAATRLGATVARADDIECLDWNKQEKTAHILATGSSGGFVTVWDAKQKKDILTLNNQGRKAVSAVAWDPEESTKLATATPNDQDPVIYLWSLRNSSAPERTLKGHELGVLTLSWCQQDPELLLSAGKDNQTVCWNPRTGEKLGDFTAGSNWAFQTEWNPHNPSLIASASFDGKILITSTQSTNAKPEDQTASSQALDGEDFFAKAQTQPQGITFSLPKAPKWAARPVSVSFGFGGKLVRLSQDATKKSKVSIETFEADSSIGESATKFEEKLKSGDLAGICEEKIQTATTDEERADWQIIETLNAGKSRKKLREYIGFNADDAELAQATEKLAIDGDTKPETNGTDDDFFGNGDDDSFLANLAATKGARTNNPFQIYTESESEADKSITRALMLGQFEKALDICLKEDRMSDAFMIAVCGGQNCIDKAQNAYLKKKAKGPNYLRLLASIVGKNLWDVVHNADLQNWKEVMATLCTYADETEFADLCEALGDRLEETFQEDDKPKALRKDASFCYLAGSKLEKVVSIWVEELQEQEKAALEVSETDNSFSVHAKCLQHFMEKVSVFRKVTAFQDAELSAADEWKLAPLYRLYEEYADVLASHGQLAAAEQYLNLLPAKFGGAESAQQRIRQATANKAGITTTAQRQVGGVTSRRAPSVTRASLPAQQPSLQPAQPLINQARNAPSPYSPIGGPAPAVQNPYAPAAPAAPAASNPYAPAGYQAPQQTPYGQIGPYGGYHQPPQQQAPLPPPPRTSTQSPSAPPPSQQKTGDWNDMPANFFKDRQPRSRAGTPGPQPIASPFANAQLNTFSPPPPGPTAFQKPTPPLPPPPRAGEAPPRIMSPATVPPQVQRSTPAAANAYAPAQPSQSAPGSTLPTPHVPPVQRGASPYQPPPSTSNAAPSNRYAPAPGTQPTPAPGAGALPPPRQVAPNPYAAQQPSPYAPAAPQQAPYGQPPMQTQAPPAAAGPPRAGPPRGPHSASTPAPPPNAGPPPRAAPPSAMAASPAPSSVATPPPPSSSAKPRYPKGDRSHIQPQAQPIVEILAPAVAHIKSVAPQNFKPQIDDMEKRINILFDHLNNDDLLQPGTVQEVVEISRAIQGKEWDRASELFTAMQKRMEAEGRGEGGNWMVGVRRLIQVSKATAR
ncbi:WD40 repeat-like protein [Teratosphaeria nubilosa]|uniref:Protein transport protein SEC31 n=1 Tax=Teratosphaeria nubilosa TaxID=161662 RepID=A0A6G1L7S8_9PEZI|nr:WD40 repeat-like protein [Teratosphaeria nubilosa]